MDATETPSGASAVEGQDEIDRSAWLQRVACRAARLGGWTIDLPERILTWSEENCAIHEVPPGYRPTLEEGIKLFPEEHRAEVIRKVEACARDGTPYEFELPKYTAKGRLIWVHSFGEAVRDSTGRIVRLQGAFQDITEQKLAAEALRQSDERFRLLSRVSSDAIRDWDIASGAVWWNEGFAALFGDTAAEDAGTNAAWLSRVHPADRGRVGDEIRAAIDAGLPGWITSYRFARSDGRHAYVQERGHVIRDAQGIATRTLAMMSDVTEKLALEEQLRQSQRLESIGRLTGGVAHDFNNLLTVILGAAGLLTEELADQADRQSMAQMIVDAAGRCGELTQRLLAFARQQVLEPRPVDVAQLVERMQPLLRRTLGERIEVGVRDSAAGVHALVDPGQLENAILNLALNARDAMPGGGGVTIETSALHVAPDRAGHAIPPGDYALLTVRDTGAGIAPEHLGRVFEPFFTTKPLGKGTGLGLAMVYGFVKQSNGHVTIDSEPGNGTTVKLCIPRTAAATPASAPDARVDPGSGGGGESILLVEDDELVRMSARRHLSALGYRVLEAANGAQALALLNGGARVDLLFTDIVMPGMQGTELARTARSIRPGLKVLFTSGFAGDAGVEDERVALRASFLGKPYRRPDLAIRVRDALDRD
ncbi:MAG TPA: PAS domain-containing protein [Usitatibacter sp.]|nr:PAS domain-containing protein [Usitatibacter sp.]